MATERLVRTALDITSGILQKDIGQVVKSIMDLVLTVRNNKQKCQELASLVQSAADAVCCVEKDREEKGPSSAFSDDKYKTSLQQFLIVVQDCEEYVRRYSTKGSAARVWSALRFEEGFLSLNTRLENARKWFDFALQVKQTAALDDLKDQLASYRSEVKALQEGRMDPDDLQLSNVTVGESLVEGYILAGRLDDATDVILVATEQQKKEASILKRLSDKDSNILRFYGTFSHGVTQKYLVFERPGQQPLQTLYDWKMEEGHKNEWRLKRTMALEIAMGLDSAHIAGIVHKNLRSSNIFLTDDAHPKIFGFFKGRVSSQISDKKWTDGDQLRWAAPEMLTKDRPQYNEKCDIFSLGVIMWELITDEFPFFELHGTKGLVEGRVKRKTKLTFQRSEVDVPFLVDFKQASLDCMNDTPADRPATADVVRRLMRLAPEEMCVSLAEGPA